MSEKGRMKCVVTSAEKTTTYKGLLSVSLPAASGLMQVLPGHAESFVAVNGGSVILKGGDDRIETLTIGKSECHIRDDVVTIVI